MIRMYEYESRVDDVGNAVDGFRDFQNYLFTHPYNFIWDFAGDKVIIYNVAYRISSMQHLGDKSQIICQCMCGGGSGGGGTVIAKLKTDISLQGEGNDTLPLGVQLSKRVGNRLQVLDDGCFVGDSSDYVPPVVALSSNIPQGEYLSGESLENMILTVTVSAGSEKITDVRLYNGKTTLHVFTPVNPGSHVYTFNLTTALTKDAEFHAVVSDGQNYESEPLAYKFIPAIYVGVCNGMTVTPAEITAATALKVTGSSFDHLFTMNKQHFFMCCAADRVIKTIKDENGFDVTAGFKKTNVSLTIADKPQSYTLYMFDTEVTVSNFKVTFNF